MEDNGPVASSRLQPAWRARRAGWGSEGRRPLAPASPRRIGLGPRGEAAILPRVPWATWGEGLLLGLLAAWPSSHLASVKEGRERLVFFPSYRTEGFLLPLGF